MFGVWNIYLYIGVVSGVNVGNDYIYMACSVLEFVLMLRLQPLASSLSQ